MIDEPNMKVGNNVNPFIVIGVLFLAFPFVMQALGTDLHAFIQYIFFTLSIIMIGGGVLKYANDNL